MAINDIKKMHKDRERVSLISSSNAVMISSDKEIYEF